MGASWILLRLLFVILLGYILYRLLWTSKVKGSPRKSAPDSLPERMERDPVCGAFVPRSQAVVLKNKQEVQHFCSEACRKLYEENPEHYHN
jgi:YHS domain-containing protein